jgi:hypothetical protein
MFKSERRPRQHPIGDRGEGRDRGGDRTHNIDFRGFNEKKKLEVKLTEADFPELVEKNSVSEKEECKLNFKDAYMKEAIEEVDEDSPPPQGWTRYRVKNGAVIIDGDLPKREEEDYTAEEYHYDATQIFGCLINSWNDYKNNYNELHGEEEYERIHSMPNCDSFFDDDCEDYYR